VFNTDLKIIDMISEGV